MKKRVGISCSGVVQGIGFRPFVYRIAVENGLVGFIQNLGDAGVNIVVEGEETQIESFINSLKRDKPSLAFYRDLSVTPSPAQEDFSSFRILESDSTLISKGVSNITPDIATCSDCIRDLRNPRNERYRYPFVVCSSCGPRFTVIEELPYDRKHTTMTDFPMCKSCRVEYGNPLDRRFHAEPVCCDVCGPVLSFSDLKKSISSGDEAVRDAAEAIRSGKIVAVKGIGGVHLASQTTSDAVVLRLRERRKRPFQPLAVMSLDIETVKTFAKIDEEERSLLISYRRPIVVLEKSSGYFLSEWVSPGLHTIGVMLPYSGIHHLLLQESMEPAIVLTSGNYPGLPMAITNNEIKEELAEVADFFLLHNRRIVNRCDDSVVRDVAGAMIPIRRSRGYVPEPVKLPIEMGDEVVFACGVEERSTSCVLKNDHCFMSQHIGDVDNLETLSFLKDASKKLWQLCSVTEIDKVACDLHPLFLSTRWARELSEEYRIPLQSVQHHHAHIVSLMAEYGIGVDEQILGIALDGVGYGYDSTAWGGELLLSSYESCERIGHLETHGMPGGDLCVRYPIRMAASILSKTFSLEEISELLRIEYPLAFRHGLKEVDVVIKQLASYDHLPTTSSAGRVLDAAAALLGICYERTYNGEPAIKLESAAAVSSSSHQLSTCISDERRVLTLNTSQVIAGLLEGKKRLEEIGDLAFGVQFTLAKGIGEMAVDLAERENLRIVGLSGGVAYNDHVVRTIEKTVSDSGLRFLKHRVFPPGDAGVSPGQALVAWAKGE
ncbi:MAG: carbamoyltransferase HypF [Candidatus Bathyarchaeota archaeon]|nr:MAG: carbamoyltransferase HypF [Candidatus Bathyarchaeota archaeon]